MRHETNNADKNPDHSFRQKKETANNTNISFISDIFLKFKKIISMINNI